MGNGCLKEVSRHFFLFVGGEFIGKGITANVCVSAVAGIGGLSNGAKRNAKADQLRPVPRHNVNKENESNEDTEPRHCRNILLAAGLLSSVIVVGVFIVAMINICF